VGEEGSEGGNEAENIPRPLKIATIAVDVVRKEGGNQAAESTGPDIMATGPDRPLRNWPKCIHSRTCKCAEESHASGHLSPSPSIVVNSR
jgi:hypothetical protein